jgi:hypothetical protein
MTTNDIRYNFIIMNIHQKSYEEKTVVNEITTHPIYIPPQKFLLCGAMDDSYDLQRKNTYKKQDG